MDIRGIKNLLKNHENLNLEYKTAKNSLPKDFWKTYSAFANTKGGDVILGIDEDDNKNPVIVGVLNSEKIKTELFSTLSDKDKVSHDVIRNEDVAIFNIDGKEIIYVHVPEATLSQKPVYLNKNIALSYIRKYEGDHKVSSEELGALLRNQSDSLDNELLNNYTIEDLDMDSVMQYQSILNQRYPSQKFLDKTPEQFLMKIGVFQYDYNDNRKLKLTLGGLLFFGKYNAIIARLPHYHVDFFDKRGDNERWDDRVSSGDFDFPDLNLFRYYTIVSEKLLSSIDHPFKLDNTMVRKSYSELDVALRETFVNMIVHADYLSNSTSLTVEIHNPYYIFKNPGIMKIPVDSFFKGSQSKARNHILVILFTRMGAAERAGSGSQKILNVVVKNGFKEPEITTSLEQTTFKLWIADIVDVTSKLTELEKMIYMLLEAKDINSNGLITLSAKEIEAKLPKYSASQIKRALIHLSEKNFIQKLGGNRNRRYARKFSDLEIIKKMDELAKMVKNHL